VTLERKESWQYRIIKRRRRYPGLYGVSIQKWFERFDRPYQTLRNAGILGSLQIILHPDYVKEGLEVI
jgi:hypothetical protein